MHGRPSTPALVQPAILAVWCRALGLLAGSAMVLLAQAAPLQDPVDVLQAQDSLRPAAIGSTLERALSIDTSSSQRNLDLLLEARVGTDLAAAGPARTGDLATRRPALPMALVPAAAAVAGVPAPPLPLGLQSNDAVIEAGRTLRREWLGMAPGGLGRGGMAMVGDGMPGVGSEARPERADRADDAEPGLRQLLLSDAAQFLRDNRFLLLGGVALAAVLGVGLQAYTRRS